MESGAQEALHKRNEGEGPLVIEEDQLEAKLVSEKAQNKKKQFQATLFAIKAQIKENGVHKQKLMEVISNCQKMKQLPPEKKVAVLIRKSLKKTLKEVKNEVKLANDFLNRVKSRSVERGGEVILFHLIIIKTIIVHLEFTYKFIAVCERDEKQNLLSVLMQLNRILSLISVLLT